MTTTPTQTREQWLRAAVLAMEPLLREHGTAMPERWRVSIGFPTKRRANGECHDFRASADATTEMFISPTHIEKNEEGGQSILSTLLHEMIHAAVGLEEGHGGEFKRVARALNFTGKLTATTIGPNLLPKLEVVISELGPIPHGTLQRVEKQKGKNGGYWPTFVSPVEPSYRLSIREKSLEEFGPPLCPISGEPMIPAPKKGEK